MKKKRKVILIIFIVIAVVFGCCVGYSVYICYEANVKLNDFISACAAGNTVKMETFLPKQNTGTIADNSSNNNFDKKIENELAVNQKSTNTKFKTDSSPSLQSVILKCNQYHAKRVWTITDKATATITVVGPDTRKIVESTLTSLNGTNATQDQLYTRLVTELKKSPKTIKKDVEVPLTRINGIWYIQFDNREILDELTNGLNSAYNDSYTQALKNMQSSGSTGGKK